MDRAEIGRISRHPVELAGIKPPRSCPECRSALGPLINPANRQIWYGPVDAITTERGAVAVCLSDAMRRLDALVPVLEKMLSAAYAGQLPAQEHHAADITVSVVMKILPKEPPA
jgi:hypothetical protein